MKQLNIFHFLNDLEEALRQQAHQEQDETPTQNLDEPEQSIHTKLELITSAYLDGILASNEPLTLEQARTIKTLVEAANE